MIRVPEKREFSLVSTPFSVFVPEAFYLRRITEPVDASGLLHGDMIHPQRNAQLAGPDLNVTDYKVTGWLRPAEVSEHKSSSLRGYGAHYGLLGGLKHLSI